MRFLCFIIIIYNDGISSTCLNLKHIRFYIAICLALGHKIFVTTVMLWVKHRSWAWAGNRRGMHQCGYLLSKRQLLVNLTLCRLYSEAANTPENMVYGLGPNWLGLFFFRGRQLGKGENIPFFATGVSSVIHPVSLHFFSAIVSHFKNVCSKNHYC